MWLEQASPGPIGRGTTIRRRNTHWGAPIDGEMEIVEWEPERAIGTRIRDGNLSMAGRATFEAVSPGETLLTITADVPDLDESRAAGLQAGMERTASNIRTLMEADGRADGQAEDTSAATGRTAADSAS